MADVVPFRALRPKRKFVQAVASLPYDVMDLDEAKKIADANPLSFLHVERSEVDVKTDESPYPIACNNLQKMIHDGILLQDSTQCFYIYRQKMGRHEQCGIAACISVAEYESGIIKKHEMTTAEKEKDRINHVLAVNAQTGPVFVAYRASDEIDRIVARLTAGHPEYDFVADDGILHSAWLVDQNADISAMAASFSKVKNLYIADGHHRAAAAAAVGKIKKEENPNHTGAESYNHILAVLFPDNQVRIMEYNRAVKDLNGLTEEEFIMRIGNSFNVITLENEKLPRRLHDFDMYLGGRWYRIIPKEGTYDPHNPIGHLDVSILQENLLGPVLGIDNPRTNKRIEYIGGIRGMAALEDGVNSGKYAVAFSLFPTTMDQLFAVADAGLIMPPKSTWFEPKLRSGVFVHLL